MAFLAARYSPPQDPGISVREEMQRITRRRELLGHVAGALTGLAFVGCGLVRPALSQAPQRRREVVMNGKRVRTIDLHAHFHFPVAHALLGLKVQFPSLVISPERAKVMDEQGIDIEALSLNPIFWYKAEPDLAGQVVKLQNEKLTEICAAQPDRFVGLASVALQHPDLAAAQLEDAIKNLGLRGALIGGSVNGEELSDPKFHPFWAKAEQLGALIFIHPQGTAELRTSGRLNGNGVLDNVIGNPLETTIALSHLIFEGTLDAYPGLKICAAHAGGFLPSYAARSDQGCVTFPQRCTKTLKKRPSEYLQQLYYDSLIFTPEGLRHPDRRSRREPDRIRDGLSVSLDQDGGRPHPRYPRIERCRARCDARRNRGEAPEHQAGVDCR